MNNKLKALIKRKSEEIKLIKEVKKEILKLDSKLKIGKFNDTDIAFMEHHWYYPLEINLIYNKTCLQLYIISFNKDLFFDDKSSVMRLVNKREKFENMFYIYN